MTFSCSIVVPTVGRPELPALLDSLRTACAVGPQPFDVVVVDDRPFPDRGRGRNPALDLGPDPVQGVRVLRTGGRGPAAARNVGWRSVRTEWVAFLDDDVVVPERWAAALKQDLTMAGPDVAGVQGRIAVPLPGHRPPTDLERNTAGLETAAWPTADMAYRRVALLAVHGFDERFARAYREDADLALRVRKAGWDLEQGVRFVEHPVRAAGTLASVRAQAGNADDALLRTLHGPDWRRLTGAGRGRLPWHVATVAAGLTALGSCLAAVRPAAPNPRTARTARTSAVLAGSAWAGLTAAFAAQRLAPGPRPGDDDYGPELRRMVLTSVLIPFAAVGRRLLGTWRWRRALGGNVPAWPLPIRAVLFDRDGTLVHDVPYNGDPDAVEPMPGARRLLDGLRADGLRIGVVSNQSAIGRGLLTSAQVDAVDERVGRLLGPFDTWQRCPHRPEDECACRKPEPGLVLRAAAELRMFPAECVVVGDIGSDVGAAVASGARSVLVPTEVTRREELSAAPVVAATLEEVVTLL
ncbi:histidinol-phosphate phosphatase family domain-containing protein/HAD-superfamily hydrolase, subfamily IIIA [Promicromonospora umidemergens]|uniref:D,D-heptose 1,7-bisphosphate phosphatase n=1 Tax=Promicromonospora umidemergens TaxID=629679 RepID=A0ABP8WZB6_9MICO|nr:HAD-IIIA family hydrolase [Promicromonospora umidemergens]MCP2283739.1 histidinol-phosphate phosphatase family domain-containing protein/HAD-superfamily hydrolase, subfamily IIIA [Promicromonospora umidemergens]